MWVDPDKMRAYNLAITDVANALRQQNMELPAGNVNAGARELTVRTLGRLVDPAQFNEIAIATRGPYVVKLRDIGHAEDSQEEPTTAARLNGEPAVTLVVSKQSGQNTVATADALKERMKRDCSQRCPKDIHIEIINDQSIFIKAHGAFARRASDRRQHSGRSDHLPFPGQHPHYADLGGGDSDLHHLDLRADGRHGFDLNQITMLALTLMVGIVIDDAIIVLENIYRFMEEKGMSPYQAAIEGTQEIGLAVMATTLSLLAVFLPIGFMGGIVGRFMSSFGFTASFAIAVSLLVSFTLTPMLSSRFIKVLPKHEGDKTQASKDSRLLPFPGSPLHADAGLVDGAPQDRWSRISVAGGAAAPCRCSCWSARTSCRPTTGPNSRSRVRAPEGTSLAATMTIAERIARDIRGPAGRDRDAHLDRHRIGGIRRLSAGEANSASIYVKLVPRGDQRANRRTDDARRARDSQELSARSAHQRRAGADGRRRRTGRRAIRAQRSGSRQALRLLAAMLAEAQTDSQRRRCGYVAGLRQAGTARRNRPPARGRPGRARQRYRARPEHAWSPARWSPPFPPAANNTTCGCAPRAVSAPAPKACRS